VRVREFGVVCSYFLGGWNGTNATNGTNGALFFAFRWLPIPTDGYQWLPMAVEDFAELSRLPNQEKLERACEMVNGLLSPALSS
jgi:hypothetical protein